MTDRQAETESETMNHDDIYATPEGGEGEPWQGDLPPADDFHDEAGDAAPYGEDPDQAAAAGASSDEDAKKRGRMVLLSVFGVIGVFGAGLAYMNLSSPAPEGPVAVPAAMVLGSDVKKNIPGTYAEEKPANEADMLSPRTAETDISSLYAKGGAGNGGAVALPGGTDLMGKAGDKAAIAQAPTSGLAPDSEKKEIPSLANSDPAKPVAASAQTSVEANLFAPTNAGSSAVGASVPTEIAAIPAVKDGAAVVPAPANDTKVQELSTEVETLKKALDEALRHAQDLSQRLEASNAAERQVRQELDSVKAQKSAAKAPASIVVQDNQAADMYAEPVASKKKTAHVAKSKKTTKASAKKVARHDWTLRAATPDAAWVSKGADATDLERVHVGDSVAGIGVVKAIRQKGEAWEVVGSKGVIQ